MKLKDIVKYTGSGLVLTRYQAKSDQPVKQLYRVLTIKSLDNYGKMDETQFEELNAGRDIPDKYVVQPGDVFIRNSIPFTAGFFPEEISQPTLVSSNFTILRVDKAILLPQYLAIYLNSLATNEFFNRVTSPSSMKFIKAETIQKVEIELISLEKQQAIIELHELMQKELQLLKSIYQKKEDLYRKIINAKIGGEDVK
ncbi:MAG: hypothetical protein WC155_07390 [Candidatus Cloacimonadales bacterium]